MDSENVKKNITNVFAQLMVLRLIVSSPSEKVADLPMLYVILCALLAPWVCISALILGFIFRYGARVERA